MKGIIIYKSACGSTKEYADWIAEETGFSAIPLNQAGRFDLSSYDTVVAGSLVIAGRIVIGKWITTRWDSIRNKKIVLFSTSGAKPDDEVKTMFLNSTFPPEMAEKLTYFPLHGRRRHKDLSVMAKLMMWIAVKFIAKTPEEKEEMSRDFDGVARENLKPLLAFLKS